MGLLESFIAWASPERAARRQLARVALNQAKLIGYRDGTPTRLDPSVRARGASPDWSLELGFDRREIVDRARQLERDNALACSLLDRATEHVIGDGFQLKVKTKDKGWNEEAETLWQDWCLGSCDSRGMQTFGEMISTIFRSWLRDGDIAALLESDGSIRLVESDEIASPIGGYTRPSDADGVELDRRGRIKSFWVFDYDPSVLWSDRRRAIPRLIQIPANDMIFLARRQRAGQTRGVSAFTGISWLLEQLDDAIEAVAVAHRMAACAGLVLSKKSPLSGITQGTNSNGDSRPELNFEPGMVLRIDPDESVTQVNPAHPSGTFQILCDALMRFAGTRFGLPLEILNYDFSKSNYSNMRAASLETALATRIKQKLIVSHFCSAVWGWKLANWIRTGALPPRKDASEHSWSIPGKPWVDPEVELRAAMGSIDAGLDTRRQVLARRGLDFEEVVLELAEENKLMRKLGLPDIRGSLTRDAIVVRETVKEDQPGGAKNRLAAMNGASHP